MFRQFIGFNCSLQPMGVNLSRMPLTGMLVSPCEVETHDGGVAQLKLWDRFDV